MSKNQYIAKAYDRKEQGGVTRASDPEPLRKKKGGDPPTVAVVDRGIPFFGCFGLRRSFIQKQSRQESATPIVTRLLR